jgi:hypothetical protein
VLVRLRGGGGLLKDRPLPRALGRVEKQHEMIYCFRSKMWFASAPAPRRAGRLVICSCVVDDGIMRSRCEALVVGK